MKEKATFWVVGKLNKATREFHVSRGDFYYNLTFTAVFPNRKEAAKFKRIAMLQGQKGLQIKKINLNFA